jgi:hypothetical protein
LSAGSTPPIGAVRPPLSSFTRRERRVIARLRTPLQVQRFLNALPYNTEPPPEGATQRTFRGVINHHSAHCLEAALTAAVILEQHGWPPLVMSFESIDELDHVLFVYRRNGRWGSIGRSRDPGLHGRKPVFATPRALALSYVDPYVDYSGRVVGYAVVNLAAEMGDYDWRLRDRGPAQHRELRLAAVSGKRLEGRTDAAGITAPAATHSRRANRSPAEAISGISRALRPQAGVLQAHGSVDGTAPGVYGGHGENGGHNGETELTKTNEDTRRLGAIR